MLQYTLQTLVQLNILILATPALAGWIMPLAHTGVVRAVCTAGPAHRAEAVAPKAATSVRHPLPAVQPHLAVTAVRGPANQVAAFSAPTTAAVASFKPFPQATRAP